MTDTGTDFTTRKGANTEIVGIRLPPQLAYEFKLEAARRGLRVNQLFIEMWNDYRIRAESDGC